MTFGVQLVYYWCSTDYHYWQIADVLFSQPLTYLFLTYPFKMYFYK